jgi:hypothetical protein
MQGIPRQLPPEMMRMQHGGLAMRPQGQQMAPPQQQPDMAAILALIRQLMPQGGQRPY